MVFTERPFTNLQAGLQYTGSQLKKVTQYFVRKYNTGLNFNLIVLSGIQI